MPMKDFLLDASEEAGMQDELRRQKSERLAEARAEEEWRERDTQRSTEG